MNQKLLLHLKDDGLLNMVVHHIFLRKNIISTPSHRSPEAVLNNILQHRYRIHMSDNKEIIRIMKRLKLWDKCREEYEKKYSIM